MPTPLASQTWQNLVIIETASYSPLLDLEAIKPKNQLDLYLVILKQKVKKFFNE